MDTGHGPWVQPWVETATISQGVLWEGCRCESQTTSMGRGSVYNPWMETMGCPCNFLISTFSLFLNTQLQLGLSWGMSQYLNSVETFQAQQQEGFVIVVNFISKFSNSYKYTLRALHLGFDFLLVCKSKYQCLQQVLIF